MSKSSKLIFIFTKTITKEGPFIKDSVNTEKMDELTRQKSTSQSWKIKVYLLSANGNWDDCGTGLLEMAKETNEDEEIDYLKVTTNEELIKGRSTDITAERYEKLKGKLAKEEKILLYLPLLKRNQYEKQGGNILA